MRASSLRPHHRRERHAPEDLSGFFAFLIVPPGPPFPPEIQSTNMCGIVWRYASDPEGFDEAPVRQVDGLAFEWEATCSWRAGS